MYLRDGYTGSIEMNIEYRWGEYCDIHLVDIRGEFFTDGDISWDLCLELLSCNKRSGLFHLHDRSFCIRILSCMVIYGEYRLDSMLLYWGGVYINVDSYLEWLNYNG